MGIGMTVVMPFVLSKSFANLPPNAKTGQPAMPPGAITAMVLGMTVFFFVFFVVVPAVWTFFYNSRHVKATCEARDPVTRWTDACPLPVLGYCLWTWFAVPMMLMWPLTGMAVMPCFGMFVSGLPGALFCLVIAAVWGWAGWWLYRLDARGWWLIFVAMVLFMVSALLTYAHHDISEMYQLQGLPQAQIDLIQKMGLFTGNRISWFTALFTLPFLGYLLFIKKYCGKGEMVGHEFHE
jgi:Sec-independent protein secretion pathway component TatC